MRLFNFILELFWMKELSQRLDTGSLAGRERGRMYTFV